MAAYDAYLLGLFPATGAGSGPLNHYQLDETSGTTWADTGRMAGNGTITKNGTVTSGAAALLADSSTKSAQQDKDTVMGTRADNGLFDRIGSGQVNNKLTLIAWIQLDRYKGPGGNKSTVFNAFRQTLVMKGTDVYGLSVRGTGLTATVNGQSELGVDDVLAPGASTPFAPPVYMVSTVFDGAARTWASQVNAVEVASRGLAAGQVINYPAGGALQVGGYNASGANGFSGRISRVSVFMQTALTAGQLQRAYELGTIVPGAEGNTLAYVYPWARNIGPGTQSYESVFFTNNGRAPVWLSRGGTAAVRAGERVDPGVTHAGGHFNGQWSAISEAREVQTMTLTVS